MLKSKQLIIALLAFIVTVDIHVGRVSAQVTKSCNDRKKAGVYCETCTLLATCVQLNETDWTSIPLEFCSQGFFCDSNIGTCSNTTGSCYFTGGNTDSIFTCNGIGIFPDPYDCQVYHTCYYEPSGMLVEGKLVCEQNTAFDAATSSCSRRTSDPVCLEKQYNCTQPGKTAPWPGNAQYYYVCKIATSNTGSTVIFPEIYRCNDGYEFKDNGCRNKGTIDNGSAGGNTAGNNETGDSSTGGTTNSSGVCKKVGLNPHPSDCHSYFYCNSINNQEHFYTCPPNTYFDQVTSACKMGNC